MTDATIDAQTAFSGTREVDPRYRLDEEALDAWMAVHVAGYVGPLTMRQFKGGQSNPTYELTTPGAAYVLRRKPPGVLLPSAHAVDREFQVISALAAQGFPVARPHALCMDETVIGSIFYVMDKVEGRIFWDLKLPGLTPTERRAVYEAQTDALARLHAFDPDAIGLTDYGKAGNYFARQVGRWTKQYRASEIEPIPSMDRLIAFLPDSKKFVQIRVPYPLGFFARGMDGRIDDAKAGWKGRALWTNYASISPWNAEGGKGGTSKAVKFQVRPDPLAQ